LPDGNIITVDSKRDRCPEVIFQPSFIGKEASGIHDTTSRFIIGCDIDIMRDFSGSLLSDGIEGVSLRINGCQPEDRWQAMSGWHFMGYNSKAISSMSWVTNV
jgi:hypothetical protein